MPPNKTNPRTWIPEILKDATEEKIIFKNGSLQNCIIISLLFSNWVVEMIETLLVKNPLAACFIFTGDSIESFFWDGPRDIMTVSITSTESLELLATNVLIPLWSMREDKFFPSTKTKEVVVQESSKEESELSEPSTGLSRSDEKLLSKIEWLLRDVDVNDTLRRIERAEAILGDLQHKLKDAPESPTNEMDSFFEKKMKDTLDKLDHLTERLASLETRINKICESFR
jgi:hypothetical protein